MCISVNYFWNLEFVLDLFFIVVFLWKAHFFFKFFFFNLIWIQDFSGLPSVPSSQRCPFHTYTPHKKSSLFELSMSNVHEFSILCYSFPIFFLQFSIHLVFFSFSFIRKSIDNSIFLNKKKWWKNKKKCLRRRHWRPNWKKKHLN